MSNFEFKSPWKMTYSELLEKQREIRNISLLNLSAFEKEELEEYSEELYFEIREQQKEYGT